VTNIFLFDYETRLLNWSALRKNLTNLSLDRICVEVDAFWQKTPIQNYYLHRDFIPQWPDPWQLLLDNVYCQYARGLGMIYTLWLLGIQAIDFVEAKDDNNNEVVLVIVDNAKYVLNYWPGTVLNNRLHDFVITNTLDILPLHSKLGLK
jgi:hypothetical protein